LSDASYDAVIIGGGNKGLILAMYLARYGGMSVGIFEKRHEAGGGWSTEEGPAPGFLADYHATSVAGVYHVTTTRDFPEWRELGGEMTTPRVAAGGIFKEDDSSLVFYSKAGDPSGELTASSIAKFSQRDAETWLKIQKIYLEVWAPYYMKFVHNPPPVEGPDAMDKLVADPKAGIDPSWLFKSPLEVLRDIFESDALIAVLTKFQQTQFNAAPSAGGMGLHALFHPLSTPIVREVIGGTHNWAHAAVKIFLADGGKIFTNSEVDRVVIENGRARGIVLADGTQIEARKMVVSTLDPYSLCFRLIGKEQLSWQILRRVENLERRDTCITWYSWALHERPHYSATRDNPEVDETYHICIVSKEPEALDRLKAMRMLGVMPREEDLQVSIYAHVADKTRAPEGKCVVMTEQFVLPANALTEEEWLEFKKLHAEDIMKLWYRHAANMTWDNVIGYVPLTPYDHCRMANMAPTGLDVIIDNGIPGQYGRFRPVPELARHRTPIKNLYATGSGWHPYGGAFSWQGYNCYKIIAEDFSLRKPWEEQGYPF
jgi:phytoene dehydrogenase-like protein